MGSLSHSLFTRLIPMRLLEAGAQGISIVRAIRLVDRTLQMYFSNKLSSNTPHCTPLECENLDISYSIDISILWIEERDSD